MVQMNQSARQKYRHRCREQMYGHQGGESGRGGGGMNWEIGVDIYTMEYYSAIKRNKIESFVETWMDLETVIQSEVSQKVKNKYRILTHVCGT